MNVFKSCAHGSHCPYYGPSGRPGSGVESQSAYRDDSAGEFMHISRLAIENFRCIRSLDVALSPTSVIIGENNVGKTAILDAVKIAMSRRWGRSGQTGFTEYDFPFGHDQGAPRP